MPRVTLRERFFQLHQAADVDEFLPELRVRCAQVPAERDAG